MSTTSIQRYRIAVVEDDHHLRHDLIDFLLYKGHEAVGCESAESFVALHARRPVQLLLLDIGLPGMNGLDLVKRLRSAAGAPGIVLLSSFGAEETRIQGLLDGADGYLVKGASLDLIEATCVSLMRRLAPSGVTSQHNGIIANDAMPVAWQLDATRAMLISPEDIQVELTHMEQVFMQALLRCPGQPVSREDLLGAMLKPDTPDNARNLDNCATRLRRKVLLSTGLKLPVRACYGVGYAFGEIGIVKEL